MSRGRRHLAGILAPLAFFLVVVALWEGVVHWLQVPPYLLPPPSAIAAAITRDPGGLLRHTAATAAEAVAGFFLANLLAVATAVLFAHSRTAERTVYPYAIALKTTPIVAMAPLLVLWLGTGPASKVAAAALVSFFPMLVNATRGLGRVDQEALDLFRSLAASGVQVFLKLRLPTSLPYLFSALKVSSSLSVVGAIVGEFVGAQRGLGYLVIVSSYHLETDVMFAAVVAAAAVGVAFFGLIALAERMLVPWADTLEG